jgi:hypothetical protein
VKGFPGILPGMTFLAPRTQSDGRRAFEHIDSASFVVLRVGDYAYDVLILESGFTSHKAASVVDMRWYLDEWIERGWTVIGS